MGAINPVLGRRVLIIELLVSVVVNDIVAPNAGTPILQSSAERRAMRTSRLYQFRISLDELPQVSLWVAMHQDELVVYARVSGKDVQGNFDTEEVSCNFFEPFESARFVAPHLWMVSLDDIARIPCVWAAAGVQ